MTLASGRRGTSLVLVIAATALVGSLGLVALQTAAIRGRLVADARWRIEGQLVAGTALAATRVAHRADLDTVADGSSLIFVVAPRPDGWSWQAEIHRGGALIQIITFVHHTASDGTTYAARRASLMLARDPADTVRVLAQRARF